MEDSDKNKNISNHILTPYEKDEVKIYEGNIFYDGNKATEKLALINLKSCEDEDGRYVVYNGDHIKYKYEIIKIIGKGSFGNVFVVYDHKDKNYKALKIIKSGHRFVKQAEKEKNILVKVNSLKISNAAKILESFMFRSHPCIVFELYDINLYQFIRLNKHKIPDIKKIKNIIKQILECLVELDKNKIIHCDLKPENIVFTDNKFEKIKIIDFGSSDYVGVSVSTYIQSRYYRSPEIILDLKYDTKIDIWSLGCIAIELITGKPIFPGQDEQYLIFHICKYLGIPPISFLRKTKRYGLYFDPDGFLMNSDKYISPRSVNINRIVDMYCPKFGDFISKCLTWDPDDRLTAEEASNHPCFEE